MQFGQFIKQKREGLGVTQTQLAEALSLGNKSDIARRESGERDWSHLQVEALAAFFGLPASKLYAEYEQRNN